MNSNDMTSVVEEQTAKTEASDELATLGPANHPVPITPIESDAFLERSAIVQQRPDKAEESMASDDLSLSASAVCSPHADSPAQAAGFLRRALAFLIDLVLLHLLYLMLSIFGVLGMQLATDAPLFSSSSLMSSAAPFISAWVLLFIGYFTFFHAAEGQTPAKKILRIKVVNKGDALLPHWVALLRSCGYFLSISFLGIGFLMSMFGKKRGLHDWLTGSYVVLSTD